MNTAELIRTTREALRYSAKEVAEKAEVSERSYGAYERGETSPPIDKALRIFEVLGIPYQIGDVASEQIQPHAGDRPNSDTVGYITIAINGVGFDRWQVVREPGISDVTVNLEMRAKAEGELKVREVHPVEEPS